MGKMWLQGYLIKWSLILKRVNRGRRSEWVAFYQYQGCTQTTVHVYYLHKYYLPTNRIVVEECGGCDDTKAGPLSFNL